MAGLGRYGAAMVLALFAFTAAEARMARPIYLGTWVIAKAQPAPWVKPGDPSTKPHDAKLVGKTIIYELKRIVGPRLFACAKPAYSLKQVPPEGLFQGGLTKPAEQAKALGFVGTPIRTLETGCANWFDYHFIDNQTAMFALDNMIYTIRRKR